MGFERQPPVIASGLRTQGWSGLRSSSRFLYRGGVIDRTNIKVRIPSGH